MDEQQPYPQIQNQRAVQGQIGVNYGPVTMHFDSSTSAPVCPAPPNRGYDIPGSSQTGAETLDPSLGTCHRIYEQHSAIIRHVTWAPEGKRIASAGLEHGIIRVWSSVTGELLLMYRGHQRQLLSAVCALRWSPDGQRIASSATTRATVHVWDTATGITTLTYRGHCVPMIGAIMINDIFALAWEPKGTRIASSSTQLFPLTNADIHIWDADTGKILLIYHAHDDLVHIVAWSPDSIYVASADSAGTVQIWNSYTGKQLLTYRPRHKRSLVPGDKLACVLVWSPDGTKIASAYYDCRDVYVWDAKTGSTLLVYSGHTAAVRCLAWAPDGAKIASASYDKTVHLWDATTGERFFIYRKHTGSVEAMAWSPDGTCIASGGQDCTIHVWKAIEK